MSSWPFSVSYAGSFLFRRARANHFISPGCSFLLCESCISENHWRIQRENARKHPAQSGVNVTVQSSCHAAVTAAVTTVGWAWPEAAHAHRGVQVLERMYLHVHVHPAEHSTAISSLLEHTSLPAILSSQSEAGEERERKAVQSFPPSLVMKQVVGIGTEASLPLVLIHGHSSHFSGHNFHHNSFLKAEYSFFGLL